MNESLRGITDRSDKNSFSALGKVVRPKVLLIDDDPLFRSLIAALGEQYGLDIEAYESLQEVEPFLRMNSFSGAIIDYHLLGHNALELVGGMEAFFRPIPTLLVSGDEGAGKALRSDPDSPFSAFVSKFRGGQVILDAMRRLMGGRGGILGA